MSRSAPPAVKICMFGLVVVFALTSVAQAYDPPIGIPEPSFGIDETAGTATDTIDTSPLPSTYSLSAGDVVEIDPGTYSGGMTISGGGTAENPAYIRGASPSNMPKLTGSLSIQGAQYVIIENLDFDGGTGGCIGIAGSGSNHISIRNCNFRNRLYANNTSAIGILPGAGETTSDIVVYNSSFTDLGDWETEEDEDFHGVNPNLWGRDDTAELYNVWVLDSYFHHVSGNGVQVNAGNWEDSYLYLHHIYIGGNTAHAGRQAGFWSKQASDVIISQNKSYGSHRHGGQPGDGIGYQYGPHNLWIIFNEIWDCNTGVRQSDTATTFAGHTSYVIGNVIHDSYQEPDDLHWNSPAGWAISYWAGNSTRYIVNNTFYNVHNGVETIYPGPVTIANNITSTLKDGYPEDEPYRHYAHRHSARNEVASMDYELVYQPGLDIKGLWWDWPAFSTFEDFQDDTGQCENGVEADPQFLSVVSTSEDFLDLGSSSPAIDAADSTLIESICDTFYTNYGLSIEYDFKGRPRPTGNWDIGAFEYTSGTPSNAAPDVSAGSDDECTLPAGVTLDGTVTDDDLPDPPAAFTVAWSKISGTGTVSFGDSTAVDTTATFSVADTYVLRLLADDDDLTAYDDVSISVNAAPAGTGDGNFIESGGTVVMEAENWDDNDTVSSASPWLEDTSTAGYVGDGYMTSVFEANTLWATGSKLSYDIDFETAGTYKVWMYVNYAGHSYNNCFIGMDGTAKPEFSDATFGSWHWNSEVHTIYVTAGAHTFQVVKKEKAFNLDRIILTDDLNYTPSGTGPAESSREATNQAPTADAGSDDSITLPSVATLDGTVSDDGNPDPPGSLTVTWTKVSGPGTVTFGDSAAVDTTAGFSAAGTYVLELEADDSVLTDSDTVQIIVNADPNTAPTADAGSDDECTLPSGVTLDGTVGDDGLPDPPATVTTTWSKTSGSGTVTFGDSAAVDTTAGFSEADTYVLRLTADDSVLTDYDELTVIVNAQPAGTGPFQESGGTVVMEAENWDDNDTVSSASPWLEDTSTAGYVGDGYMTSVFEANTLWATGSKLSYDIDFETAGTYKVWMYVNYAGHSYNNCFIGMDGTAKPEFSDATFGSWHWNSEVHTIYVTAGAHTFQVVKKEKAFNLDRIILTDDLNYTPSGTGPAESSREATNQAPTADAGSDDSITLPSVATLDGTVSDDGNPDPPGSLTVTWTKVSGPGTVTFGDSAAVDTTASFSEIGTYVLQLEADDGDLTDTDTVQIVCGHTAPSANAGSDDSITLPSVATLDGTVSDDGYPASPGSVTTTWSKVSGPGTVTFGDSSAVDTTASFSEIGTYVLQLEADDGDLTDTDTVQIVCGHAAPSVNAGSDDSITLPSIATLDGTVSDDGFPASPGSVTTTWTKVSGPGTVTFGDSAAVDTTASFSEIGTYVLQLEADDGDLTDSDTVQIVCGHTAPSVDAGSDDECTLPSGVTLDGTVSDDGFPASPGLVTTTWSKTSGSGTVSFGDSAAVDTTAGFSAADTYVLRLTADDNDLSAYDELTVIVNAAPAGTGNFQESGGTVVMEAENWDDNDTVTSSSPWLEDTSTTGYVGDGYMYSPFGDNTLWATGCKLSYDIDFETAGTYKVWMYVNYAGYANNNCFIGMDGTAKPEFSDATFGSWHWNSEVHTIYVTAGTHTFEIVKKEKAFCVDRIILTDDLGYTPSGTGPAESQRASSDPAFQESGGTVVMECENFDNNDTSNDGSPWLDDTSYGGYVGSGHMTAPSSGGSRSWSDGAALTYDIDFTTAGTYYIWVRRYADRAQENEAYVGLDGTQIGGTFDGNGSYDQWNWQTHGTAVYIATGSHQFNLRRREKEYGVDRIILTDDSGYTPSGNGPAESSRQ